MKINISQFFWILVLSGPGSGSSNIWPQCEVDESCTKELPYCPDCSLVDCLPMFGPSDCPKDTLFVENVLWGCCPACVRYLKPGNPFFNSIKIPLLWSSTSVLYNLPHSIDVENYTLIRAIIIQMERNEKTTERFLADISTRESLVSNVIRSHNRPINSISKSSKFPLSVSKLIFSYLGGPRL